MTEHQQKVWNYLKLFASGKVNKKTSEQIKNELSLESGGRTNEYIRTIIRQLIFDFDCCIGSNSRGYWIITNQIELDEVSFSLHKRANEDISRSDKIIENWKNKNKNRNV